MRAKDEGTWVESCKATSKGQSEVLVLDEESGRCGKSRRTHQGQNKAEFKTTPQNQRRRRRRSCKRTLGSRTESNTWRMSCGKSWSIAFFSCEPEKRRSGTLNGKIWQMVQCSNTKSENLEHDFNEIVAEVQELGWEGRGRKLVNDGYALM